jgi:hypothetical protein
MIDLFLKFPDESTAMAALFTADARPKFANIDIIGTIYKPTGETDAEGNSVVAALDGWHANVRVVNEDATSIEQYSVTPTSPVRVWA